MAKGRLLRILAWSAGSVVILVLLIAGIAAVSFDPDSQKPRIIAALKQATGRDLQLNGRIGLGLSLRPTIVVRDVALSNPPGFSRPAMATLDSIDLRLALLPLLNRRIEIERLIVHKPDILLETNDKGEPNWLFKPAAGAAEPAPAPGSAPTANQSTTPAQAASPLGIAIQDVLLDLGTFAYRDGKTGTFSTLSVEQAKGEANSPDSPLHLTARFSLDGTDFALTADTGPVSRVTDLNATTPWPIKVMLEVSAAKQALAKVGIDGTIANPMLGKGLGLALTAEVPDLARLGVAAHQALPELKALTLRGTVSDDPKGPAGNVAVHGLALASSAGDLAGDVTFTPGTPDSLTATLTAAKFDLDAVLKAGSAGAAKPAAGTKPAAGAPADKAHHLIPDQPLPFGQLQMINADIRATIAALRAGGADYKAIEAHLILHDGVMKLDPLSADLPQGHVAMTLDLDAGQKEPPVHLTARAPGIALQGLLAALGEPAFATGNLEVLADLRGAGESPHAIAASLDGRLGLAVPGGSFDIKRLGGSAGGVLQALNPKLLNSNADALRCFAVRLDFARGIGTFHALVLASGAVNVDGNGSIDLGNETLALALRSQAVIAGAAVTVPVHVSGPLAAPRTKVDEIGIAGANAAALTGSLGSLIGAGKSASVADACPGALALARGQTAAATAPVADPAAPQPDPVQPSPAQPKQPNPARLLQQLFR